MKQLNEVMKLSEMNNLSDVDLRTIKNTITDILSSRRDMNSVMIKSQLKEGMTVQVDHKKLSGIDCTVVKVNRKKIVINCSKGRFTVPMSMLILD